MEQEEEQILKCYGNTFFFFVYRKFIRQGNDIFDSGKSYSMLTTLIIVLWIVNVALYSVKFSNNQIIIEFNDPGFSLNDNIISIIAGWFYLTSLLLIIIATNWGYKYIIPYFATIMLITTIVIIILRYGVTLSTVEQYRPISIVIIISTCIQAIVMTEYLWLYMLVPAVVRWKYKKWSPQKTTEENANSENDYEEEDEDEVNDDDDDYDDDDNDKEEEEKEAYETLTIAEDKKECEDTEENTRFAIDTSKNPKKNKEELFISLTMFPVWKFSKMVLFLVVLLPLWIPLLLYYICIYTVLLFFTILLDVDCWSMMSLFVLFSMRKKYWTFRRDLSGDGVVYRRKTWSLWNSCRLDSDGRIRAFFRTERYFSYNGSVNTKGQPHGFGQWKDSDGHGEVLSGWFYNGVPRAPHITRTSGNGKPSVMKSVKIAFFTCTDSPYDRLQFVPRSLPVDKTLYGVVGAECAVSGVFYRDYPMINFLLGQPPLRGAKSLTRVALKMQQSLSAANKINVVDTTKEILLFIPGFNSNLNLTSRTFGQFLLMGGFPEETFLPVIFIWPMGTVASYFETKKLANSAILSAIFAKFVDDIATLGYRKINVICHSMGARVFLNYLTRSGMPLSMNLLGKIVFIHPEADSVSLTRLFPSIRSYTESITVYCDASDAALFWADWINYMEFVINRSKSSSEYSPGLGRGVVTAFVDGQGDSLLDFIDVISDDTATGNVDSPHHTYFDLSRCVIEDIRQHIVEGLRAKDRISRLIQRHDSTCDAARQTMFQFLVAPPYYHH